MTDDITLLRRHTDERSEEAFAELVRRHLNLVYFAALRQTGGNAALAEDVTQKVFTDLAKKATTLTHRQSLTGWLYTSTRFVALNAWRTEQRRQAREQKAHAMNDLTQDTAAGTDWEQLRPVIDDALHTLDERDREAVLLRFFEGRPFAEVGAQLSLTEDTARMRVARALEKMRLALGRRGVTSTTAALSVALANQAGAAAPASLAATVTGGALAGAAASAATAGAVGANLFAFMNAGKLVFGLVTLTVMLSVGGALVATGRARNAEAKYSAAQSRQTTLVARLGNLESRVKTETQRGQSAELENGRLLQAAQQLQAGEVPATKVDAEPITTEMVIQRFKRAQELARTGDPETALRELLWCYDVGMVKVPNMGPVRTSGGAMALAELAGRYPPALAALQERREKARQSMLADQSEVDAAEDFGAINRALKDGAATIAVLDQLPAGDQRRRALEYAAFDDLVGEHRYADALAGTPYTVMSSMFVRLTDRSFPVDTPNADEERRKQAELAVARTTKNIEVLAGAPGNLARARALADRLLAFDGSESTRAAIQEHAARAGHPDLLGPPTH